jgi:hypothetical protein
MAIVAENLTRREDLTESFQLFYSAFYKILALKPKKENTENWELSAF